MTYFDTDNIKEMYPQIVKEELLNSLGYFKLKDIQLLSDVSKVYNIPRQTLNNRLSKLEEGKDYRKLGERQPILLTPKGVEKLLNIKGDVL